MRTHSGNNRLDDLFFGLITSGFAICLTAGVAVHLYRSPEITGARYESGTPAGSTHRDKTRVDVGGAIPFSNATAAVLGAANHLAVARNSATTTE